MSYGTGNIPLVDISGMLPIPYDILFPVDISGMLPIPYDILFPVDISGMLP
jgi:hypothetical protein